MQGTETQLRYLLALIRMPGMGPVKISEILSHHTDLSLLCDKPVTIDWAKVDEDLEWAKGTDCYLITRQDPRYPLLLTQIPSAPPLLFAKGNIELLNQPQIAIVGSRNPTPAGANIAHQFARFFSSLGLTVTSGLALGIDACAHQGALLERGGTIAVLGNGFKRIYPKSHLSLAQAIINNGLLVSEFPLDAEPLASHFPRRNRLISGLSLGTLVVEAAIKSGSLITAKYALEQGREVFAIPGSINSPLSKGCHQLIREGAKLVETAEDVLEELGVWFTDNSSPGQRKTSSLPQTLSTALQAVLRQVGFEATSIEDLVIRCGLTVSELSSALLELELAGHVRSVPGGYSRLLEKLSRDQ